MLTDDPAQAPYGWSHCLTMAQATLALAPRVSNPHRAVAIAATYVLGFRATQSRTVIDPRWQPARPPAETLFPDDDPEAAPLHRAAATRLAWWWLEHDATDHPHGEDHTTDG